MAQPKEKWHGRGTATIYEDDSIEFRPCGKGEPTQRNVKRIGNSKFYQTAGEKESNYVAHLMVPKTATDPVGDMLKDFESLTRELEPRLEKPPRTKPLLKKEDDNGNSLQVYADRKDNRLKVFVDINLDPDKNPFNPADWAYTLIGAQLNQCFTYNRKSILTAYRQQEKTSSK